METKEDWCDKTRGDSNAFSSDRALVSRVVSSDDKAATTGVKRRVTYLESESHLKVQRVPGISVTPMQSPNVDLQDPPAGQRAKRRKLVQLSDMHRRVPPHMLLCPDLDVIGDGSSMYGRNSFYLEIERPGKGLVGETPDSLNDGEEAQNNHEEGQWQERQQDGHKIRRVSK